MAIRTSTPDFFIAGDTSKWQVSYADYPASQGWSGSFYLTGPASRSLSASPNGDAFDFTLTPVLSSGLTAGTYKYAIKCTSGSEVYTAESDVIEVRDNLASIATAVMHAEAMVTLIEAAQKAMLADGIAAVSLTIAGRSYTSLSLEQLENMRGYYLNEIAMLKSGGPSSLITQIPLNAPGRIR